jgi:hypothetical protein
MHQTFTYVASTCYKATSSIYVMVKVNKLVIMNNNQKLPK